MEKTTLTEAFREFVEDLQNVDQNKYQTQYSHEQITDECEKTKDADLKSLKFFDIPVGQIYKKSNASAKREIFNHLKHLGELRTQEKVLSQPSIDLSSLPLANILSSVNTEMLASLVSQNTQPNDTPVDIIRRVVNSSVFEKVFSNIKFN